MIKRLVRIEESKEELVKSSITNPCDSVQSMDLSNYELNEFEFSLNDFETDT